MATGVKPRDEEHQLTRNDLEVIQDAMKNKKFRDLLAEYCEEVRDPANQALYQEEMTKLEKERGYDVTFINPKGGYVIKTSVAGDRKAFINICSNEKVNKPSCKIQEVDGQRGMNWSLPYSIIPPRDDYDRKKERCVIYDVVFHPDTLRMAEVNKRFRELVNKTAMEGLSKTYNIHFDSNNFRFPKSQYKGMIVPAVIRKEDPDYKPPTDEDSEEFPPDLVEKLYPQHIYPEKSEEPPEESPSKNQKLSAPKKSESEFTHNSDQGYTIPKYLIKQQKNVDLQDYTYEKDSKQYSAIPSHIVVEINLPLLSSTKDCNLDVNEKALSLISEKPAKYKLNITLPYSVNEDCGNAKFDKSKHKLIVTLPVIRSPSVESSSKVDSGVESEENSGSQSDDDHRENLVVEISSTQTEAPTVKTAVEDCKPEEEIFLDSTLCYIFPPYTHNVMDDIIAFTFHVKNTEPDSVIVLSESNKIQIKFTSVGSGFVPVHYAAIIVFEESVKFEHASGEAWDNNVILQLEVAREMPHKFQIGMNEDSMISEYFDVSKVSKTNKLQQNSEKEKICEDESLPVIEVTNLGSETNIVVSSNHEELDEDDLDDPTTEEKDIVWTESNNCVNGAKSILRKPMSIQRSYSESSTVDVASSMDYISSDCIPEESSLKKTVRFNDVIARQFYRYNSSIEGQKKKNQRKKSKKRNIERRKSESEAEDEVSNSIKLTKPRMKSALKPRRDSGLADTSDAEADNKNTPCDSPLNDSVFQFDKHEDDNSNGVIEDNKFKSVLNIDYRKKEPSEPTIWESTSEVKKEEKPTPITCDNIMHKTDLYDPDRLNKGQYQEVTFKNDLIFDLDM
ncbi:protein kintoun [Plodia interpunctella]|uniref:protein kintoun n=1 Tax=Plodia interpunctella TaxID=58824 RepID=UPI00236761AB|nr:protein kintoun [Plodia interpunctella]